MCVFSGSTSSTYRETNLGFPQRLIMGPLLFCLYVNELQLDLGNGLILRLLYADDLQVYIRIPQELVATRLTEAAQVVT